VSFLWFTVMGNTAILFQSDGTADIYGAIGDAGWDESVAMFALLDVLPFPLLTTIVTIFVITVFFVTSSDSGSFVIDMIASGGSLNPPVGLRVFWALTEGAVAATLVLAGGLVRCRPRPSRRDCPSRSCCSSSCSGSSRACGANATA
jgi:choline/glycine/proline betaine transport protein